MKFAALALTLLLAVGSQAASLQADAPSQLEHFRAAMDVYLTQVKDSAKKVLDQLDGTEYSEFKPILSQRLEDMHTQIKTLQGAVAPITDNVFTTISEATSEFRSSLMTDLDSLKSQLEPKRAHLKEVIDRHIVDYRAQLEPIIKEYSERHRSEMEALKSRVEPMMEDLRQRVANNVEETKTALMPIVEIVNAKVTERLQNLKDLVTPYVNEYAEQLKRAYTQARTINTEDLTALKAKIDPLAEEIKTKLMAIYETVASSLNKN